MGFPGRLEIVAANRCVQGDNQFGNDNSKADEAAFTAKNIAG